MCFNQVASKKKKKTLMNDSYKYSICCTFIPSPMSATALCNIFKLLGFKKEKACRIS